MICFYRYMDYKTVDTDKYDKNVFFLVDLDEYNKCKLLMLIISEIFLLLFQMSLLLVYLFYKIDPIIDYESKNIAKNEYFSPIFLLKN